MSILLCMVDLEDCKKRKINQRIRKKNPIQNKLHTSGYTDVLINLHRNKIAW